MRAGVLSDDQVIAFLNEHFINAWVSNVELERTYRKQAYMASRRKDLSKTFDRTHPFAQAIMEGWKKGSPVDCLVISHAVELIGSVDYNAFPDNVGKFDDEPEAYLFFLQASLAGKRPGLGDHVLTPDRPLKEVLDTFRTPVLAHQAYTTVVIDATAFEAGGTLTIDIHVGGDDAVGIFHLLDGDKRLPTEKVPAGTDAAAWNSQESDAYEKAIGALTTAWGVFPDETGRITYRFESGQRFKLCATGEQSWGHGTINAFLAKISIQPVSEE